MSLPTLARIYKNNKVVAVACCNAGWFITSSGLYWCIKNALESVSKYFQEPATGEIRAYYNKHYPDSFGTIQDIMPFDYIEIYEYKIPFTLAMKVFFNKLSVKEFEDYCIEKDIVKGAKL